MLDDYRKALKAGRREVAAAISAGRHPTVPVLDETLGRRSTSGEVPMGVCEIPLDLVVGTKTHGRADLFSPGFMPTAEEGSEFAAKWSSLYDSQVAEGIRDPVVAYEYLQRFYVQEGNKRVSVLRYVGAPTIQANVTRVLPGPSDDPEVRRYAEFCRFYAVAPVYGLAFSQDGGYARLAALVGQTLDEPWPDEVVRALRATLYQFVRAYRARGGDALAQTVGDAFVVYLKTYATDHPLEVTDKKMDVRVARIWGELVVASQADEIAYIENPVERKQSAVKRLAKSVVKPKPLRLAFVYDRDPSVSGWVSLHDQGRHNLEERLGSAVETVAFTAGGEKEFSHAVRAAIADDAYAIITVSPRQMDETRRAAVANPGTVFANCSIKLLSQAVRTFYARMYEVKFCMGALAATLAVNHRIGYVATSPIYGSVSEINAFAIGASLVDPAATVYLKWHTAEGYDWRRELREDDVRVVADRDYPDPENPDEPYGLYCLNRAGGVEQVAVPIWDWGRYYELMVRSFQNDAWGKVDADLSGRAVNYWWGMSAGVVWLHMKAGVADGPRRLVALLREALPEGRIHPFEGALVAQRGVVVQEEGSGRLSNEEIASMRWLNYNVVGRLPKRWELSDDGAKDVEVSGVIDASTDAQED